MYKSNIKQWSDMKNNKFLLDIKKTIRKSK